MRLYASYFGFEQYHALIQLIERITVETFQAELVSGISARANPASREIIVFHCNAALTRFRLLSTGSEARLESAAFAVIYGVGR